MSVLTPIIITQTVNDCINVSDRKREITQGCAFLGL